MERLVENHDEKNWGMFCHLAALATFVIPFGNIIGPLVIYLIKRDEYHFVEDQGKESLNFQISITILFIFALLLVFAVVGVFLIIPLFVFWLVMVIVATVRASEGRYFRYPFTIRFIH